MIVAPPFPEPNNPVPPFRTLRYVPLAATDMSNFCPRRIFVVERPEINFSVFGRFTHDGGVEFHMRLMIRSSTGDMRAMPTTSENDSVRNSRSCSVPPDKLY